MCRGDRLAVCTAALKLLRPGRIDLVVLRCHMTPARQHQDRPTTDDDTNHAAGLPLQSQKQLSSFSVACRRGLEPLLLHRQPPKLLLACLLALNRAPSFILMVFL